MMVRYPSARMNRAYRAWNVPFAVDFAIMVEVTDATTAKSFPT